jgi:hypothetical protein
MLKPIRAIRRCKVAAPLMALAAFTPSDASARTATDCLAAPKGTAPQGSHWYYRWDREGQRRCWYVAPWKDKTARTTTRVRTASARPLVQQATTADQRVSDVSPATWSDEAAQAMKEMKEERIRRILYGTQQLTTMAEPLVKADPPADVELRPSLAPMQTADAGDGVRPAMSAASGLPSTPADPPDEVTTTTSVLVPPMVAVQTGSAGAPVQMTLYAIGTLAVAGGLLHVTVKLAQARRRRIRLERRSAHLLAASRHRQRALPPDRIRRFA